MDPMEVVSEVGVPSGLRIDVIGHLTGDLGFLSAVFLPDCLLEDEIAIRPALTCMVCRFSAALQWAQGRR